MSRTPFESPESRRRILLFRRLIPWLNGLRAVSACR